MQKLILLLFITFFALTFSGCSHFKRHEFAVQQGNLLKEEKIAKLRNGMSKQQVTFLLGAPVLNTTFNENRWDYVNSYQLNKKPRKVQHLSVYFRNSKVIKTTHHEETIT